MARPAVLSKEDLIIITGVEATSRPKVNSDRRAILNAVVALGGRCTIRELDLEFGFDTRQLVNSLVRSDWLLHESNWRSKFKLPTRWPREHKA